ncbi:MAG: SocA family protein [Treponema sp.]|nr:SocA family protein [Treponema sp.]
MNIEKLIQIVSYILAKYGNSLNYTKLIKILYLADRESLSETGYSITGDSYVSMRNGPVLSFLYDLIKNKYRNESVQYYWNSKFVTDRFDIYTVCSFIPTGLLSDYEIETLDKIDRKFHDYSYGKLIDYVHNPANCPEWKNTASSIPISKAEILEKLHFSEPEIKILLQEEEKYRCEETLIDSISDKITEEEKNA